ncbi:MAG TPA: DUF4190 domain-containing protein [Verrucomicrobiae bacterium]|nr:DUF4190 domain-containing protein [Verrucomicrobiae bacterium]
MYKIIGADGKEYGPISAEQVRQWIAQGRANGQTKIQLEGNNEWKSLSEFPEFAPALPATPPPLPTSVQSIASEPPRTSGMAVASLICGILGLFICITAPVGLVLGIMAHGKINRSQGRLTGSGLAIAGIILSAVLPLIFAGAFMAGLLLPALAKAKQKAQTINCMNNLKQLGLAAQMYAGDNNGKLPLAAHWCDALVTNVGSPSVFKCPIHPEQRSSYALNAKLNGNKLSEVNSRTVLLFESNGGWNSAGGVEQMDVDRHGPRSTVNVAFVDGSVRTVREGELDGLRWDP